MWSVRAKAAAPPIRGDALREQHPISDTGFRFRCRHGHRVRDAPAVSVWCVRRSLPDLPRSRRRALSGPAECARRAPPSPPRPLRAHRCATGGGVEPVSLFARRAPPQPTLVSASLSHRRGASGRGYFAGVWPWSRARVRRIRLRGCSSTRRTLFVCPRQDGAPPAGTAGPPARRRRAGGHVGELRARTGDAGLDRDRSRHRGGRRRRTGPSSPE